MEPPASRHTDFPRPTPSPHNPDAPRDGDAMNNSGMRQGSQDNQYAGSCASRRHSDRSTSSSRFTGPEPPSEDHPDSTVDPKIRPPSPPGLSLYRHHDRNNSNNSSDSAPHLKNILSKSVDKPLATPPPTGPVPRLSSRSFFEPPPPPPDHPIWRHPQPSRRESESDRSSVDGFPPMHLDWRSNSPRVPSRFPPGQPPKPPAVLPPPPPPVSPPQHSQPRRLGGQPRSRKKLRSQKAHGSDSSGSPTFSLNKGHRARAHSSSTESSGEGVDPVAARNARIFPPRFPAAITRAAPPPKATAIHNIASWVHQYERQKGRRLDPLFVPPPPPPPLSLGQSRNEGHSSFGDSSPEASEDDGDTLAHTIEHLWQALKDKRSKVAEIKSEMSQQRRDLRALRRKRDDADNALMNVLRPMLINHRSVLNVSPSILRVRLFEVQDLWNDYNHREAMYEGLELMLDEEEESLNYTEIRFFSVLAAGRAEQETAPQPQSRTAKPELPLDVPLELRGISPEGPTEELHPHYIQLTSTVGDLQNAKELHAELRAEREALEEDIAVKESTEQEIPLHTLQSLDESRAEEQRLGQRVETLQAQTDKLKAICEKEGVMRKHMSIGMQYFLDPSADYESEIELEEDLPLSNSLRHARFPELLSQPDHILAEPMPLTTLQAVNKAEQKPLDDPKNRESLLRARKEHIIECQLQGREQQSKSEFVNRWLLQILQRSSLEASCLYSTFLANSRLIIRNTTLWQKDVLHYWFRDDTLMEYDEDSEEVGGDRKNICSVGRSYADTPSLSKALSRAESAPLRGMSPISRATDESSAKTLDRNFYLPEATAMVDDAHGSKLSATAWSATTSPQMMIARI